MKKSKANGASKSPPLVTRTSGQAIKSPSPRVPLLSPSQCKGFTRISEDSSEIAFLLVENYTKTAHSVSSDRNGIFGPQKMPNDLFTFFSLQAVLYGWL